MDIKDYLLEVFSGESVQSTTHAGPDYAQQALIEEMSRNDDDFLFHEETHSVTETDTVAKAINEFRAFNKAGLADAALAALADVADEDLDGKTQFTKAEILFDIDALDDAYEQARQALEKLEHKEDSCLTISRAHLLMGKVKFEQNDSNAALTHFAKVQEFDMTKDDLQEIYNLASICHARMGNDEQAVIAARKALELHPDSLILMGNLLSFCHAAGHTDEMLVTASRHAHAQKNSIKRPFAKKLALLSGSFFENAARVSRTAEAPILLEASLDLKLPEDGIPKLIETNDLYSSGFDGFFRLTGQKMREDIIYPWQEMLGSNLGGDFEGHTIKIIRPGNGKSDIQYLCNAEADRTNIFSASVPWGAMNAYKDYLHLTTPEEWAHLFPLTAVVPRSVKMSDAEIRKRLEHILDGAPQGTGERMFIIKPCDDSVGRGVEIVRENDLVSTLRDIVRWQAPSGSYWQNHIHPNVVVQECVRSRPVMATNGKAYDGTMRIVFSALVSGDRKTVERVQFHGAYWKLPSRPYDHEDYRNSVVSFPPTSLSKIADEAFRADIPVSAKVSDQDFETASKHTEAWLRAVLPLYAESAADFAIQVENFLGSSRHEERALGTELGTSFTLMTALEKMGLSEEHASIKGLIGELNRKWLGRSEAACRYLDMLYRAPVEDSEHAAAIATRDLPILQERAHQASMRMGVKP